jgi:hypothetical protein
MSGLVGEAFVAIWHDIVPEGKTAYYEWHNREHIPERLSLAGFRRGRRYIAERGAPEYFNLYEVDTMDILTGEEYLTRLNNPTPLTQQSLPYFRNVSRSLCRTVGSMGCGDGGIIMTWQLAAREGLETELRRYLQEQALPAVFARPGVVGAHTGVADFAASQIMTEERKGRGTHTLVPSWVVLVEGISLAALEAAAKPDLEAETLQLHGAGTTIQTGIYRLETSLAKISRAAG